MTTLVELCAGAAAVSLHLVGGSALAPPCAWMGGKRKLARDILGTLGVHRHEVDRILLVDASTWGRVWPVLLGELGPLVCLRLRAWEQDFDRDRGRGPRELWEHLSTQPPRLDDPAWSAAQWLWLQARSASGVPVWWGPDLDEAGWRMGEELGKAKRGTRGIAQVGGAHWRMGSDPRERDASDIPIGQKGGAWRMGSSPERSSTSPDQPAAQAGQWLASDGRGKAQRAGQAGDTHRPEGWRQAAGGDDPRPDLKAHQRGNDARPVTFARDDRWPHGGIVRPTTIADRIVLIRDAIARWGGVFEVVHGDVRLVEPIADSVCYFDPPYQGRTGYGWRLERDEVLATAERWRAAGSKVAVSEACPLAIDGWSHVELRGGPKPEWLTLSSPPVRLPIRQAELFARSA